MKHNNEDLQEEIHAVIRMRNPDTPDADWLGTNESVETVSDLEMFAEQLNRVTDDPHRWKWAVIAQHNGLQGMMVLVLKGSNGFNVLRESDTNRLKDWLSSDQNKNPRPRGLKLADFPELYRRIKGRRMLMYIDSRKFVPNGTQGRSIKMLNRLRNDFVHFTPKVWGLDLGGLPEIASDCLEIAEFLAWESGNVRFRLSIKPDLEKRLQYAFTSAHESLWAIRQQG